VSPKRGQLLHISLMTDDEIAALLAGLERALRENEGLRAEVVGLRSENERLRRRVADLEGRLEQAQRAGKRQAAPFSRNQPAADPRRPGRHPGPEYGVRHCRPVPGHVDETLLAALPQTCPECGGEVKLTDTVEQFQEEVPQVAPTVRRFVIEVGRCQKCERRLQARHPQQSSDAVGAAGVQVGPRALALASSFHYSGGLSFGKSAEALAQAAGVKVAPSTLARAAARVARQCQEVDAELREEVRQSQVATADETGWRVGGSGAWLWGVDADNRTTVYTISPSRGGDVVEELLGKEYSGILVRDGWAPYRQLQQAEHQTCLAHLLRRCGELREGSWGRGREVPNRVASLIHEALALRDCRDRGHLDAREVGSELTELEERLEKLLSRPAIRHVGNRRLLKHLRKEQAAMFTFLRHPGVPATNWRGETAMRPAVVNRKTWGGNRTWPGAATQQILMTVLRTCRQRHLDGVAVLTAPLQAVSPPGADLLLPDTS